MNFLRHAACAALLAAAASAQPAPFAGELAGPLAANSLRADVSFLASDALKGRPTPSPELDIAAEFIAAQFRRAGLEPAGDDGFFQTGEFTWVTGSRGRRLAPAATAPASEEPAAPVRLRNVAGILRGSDPLLKDSYVILTAHYDHLGVRGPAEGDNIYNGANDNASGTALVIATANALASLPQRPKRSVVFMTFFGEETGMLGSRHYTSNPLFPLEKTVAQVNLEQMGRTDDDSGPRPGQLNATGFDYTTITEVFRQAGEQVGVQVVKDDKRSDSYYASSDNAPFALAGVPAHTLSVGYTFPDYHRPGDEWPKLDYDNMAKVARAVALGVLRLADSAEEPRWNEHNPRAERYIQARKKSLAGQ